MDIFESKGIKPMLISEQREAFNSSDWIYEIKLDGIRCIAYLDENGTDLRNKRDKKRNCSKSVLIPCDNRPRQC